MRHAPALLLLAALVGGLGASSVHRAAHALEWAEAQTSHQSEHHDADGDHAQTPCSDGDVHSPDCAICQGTSAAVADAPAVADASADADRQTSAATAHAAFRRAATPARGPPAVA